jgi:hypothetical protein
MRQTIRIAMCFALIDADRSRDRCCNEVEAMPRKPHPSDWDYFFGKRPARRQGPIALFVTLTLMLTFTVMLLVGARFGLNEYDEYQANQALTATPLWAQYYERQTATALADRPAATPQPTPTAPTITTTVVGGGNLRSEPRLAADTIIGQVTPGESVVVLEVRDDTGVTWYRVRAQAGEGWVSSTLLAPIATPTPE